MNELARGVEAGDRRALARALSLVEADGREAREVLRNLAPSARTAEVVGLTGAPGVGKSTLVDRLSRAFAATGRNVGVLAIDPSSPFSGGALLGDRIRMDDPDPRVFIRSLATRGETGGVARAVGQAMRLMEAFGKDVILIETVGAGQSEVEIMGYADVTAVVLVPGLGDDVQANKAGILEIGDIFVVNKADRPGADMVQRELRSMLSLGPKGEERPPVMATVATDGQGVDEVAAMLVHLLAGARARARRAARRRQDAERRLRETLSLRIVGLARDLPGKAFEEAVRKVADGEDDDQSAAERLLGELGVKTGGGVQV